MRRLILRNYGVDPDKVVVVSNGVDTRVFTPLEDERTRIRRELGIENETVVLYFSTFSARWRGTDQLFEIAHHITRRRRDIIFLILGSGPLLEKIKKKVPETRTQIRFVGAVDHTIVPFYINATDIFVYDVSPGAYKLTEKEGPCPIKILESMACAKPVIVPKESQLEEILRESSGGFSASSVQEIEALIERMADSPNLAKSMGVKARQYVVVNHDLGFLATYTIELIQRTKATP